MAEGTAQRFFWVEFFHWREGLVSAGLRTEYLSIILGRIVSEAKYKGRNFANFLEQEIPLADAFRCTGLYRLAVFVNNLVDHAVILGLLGIHDEIPLHILFDAGDRLSAMLRQKFVDDHAHAQDFLGV